MVLDVSTVFDNKASNVGAILYSPSVGYNNLNIKTQILNQSNWFVRGIFNKDIFSTEFHLTFKKPFQGVKMLLLEIRAGRF